MLPTVAEREEGIKDVLVSVRGGLDDGDKMLNEEANDKENKASQGTHYICNLNKVEDCWNQKCVVFVMSKILFMTSSNTLTVLTSNTKS